MYKHLPLDLLFSGITSVRATERVFLEKGGGGGDKRTSLYVVKKCMCVGTKIFQISEILWLKLN